MKLPTQGLVYYHVGRSRLICNLPSHIPMSNALSRQAFLGFENGQKCFPDPVVSNDDGTKTIKYKPSGREIVGTCINESGKKAEGLTYEGELNKVRIYALLRFVDTRRLHRKALKRFVGLFREAK